MFIKKVYSFFKKSLQEISFNTYRKSFKHYLLQNLRRRESFSIENVRNKKFTKTMNDTVYDTRRLICTTFNLQQNLISFHKNKPNF